MFKSGDALRAFSFFFLHIFPRLCSGRQISHGVSFLFGNFSKFERLGKFNAEWGAFFNEGKGKEEEFF